MTNTTSAGTGWSTLDQRRERAYSATYYLDDQEPDNAASSRSHALYLEAEQYWREVDHLLAPTRGWMASAELGGGIPALPRADLVALSGALPRGFQSTRSSS